MMSIKYIGVILFAISLKMILATEKQMQLHTKEPCFKKTLPYSMPPPYDGVHDRLCFGCNEYPSSLNRGEKLISKTGRFILSMQPDNNLVLYDTMRRPEGDPLGAVWSTDTHSYPGMFSLFMEEDGFIKLSKINDRKDTIWCNAKTSILSGNDQPVYFLLGANGEMATYQCDSPYWASNTWNGPHPFSG